MFNKIDPQNGNCIFPVIYFNKTISRTGSIVQILWQILGQSYTNIFVTRKNMVYCNFREIKDILHIIDKYSCSFNVSSRIFLRNKVFKTFTHAFTTQI